MEIWNELYVLLTEFVLCLQKRSCCSAFFYQNILFMEVFIKRCITSVNISEFALMVSVERFDF